jgi:signal transduction histidine kinase
MTDTLAPTALTLPSLIGIPIDQSRCLLNGEQVVRLGTLLIQLRPQGTKSFCFVGGALGRALNGTIPPRIIPLQRLFGDDPFVVVLGPQGAAAFLTATSVTSAGSRQYHASLYTDLAIVDQAALALAHYSDAPELLDIRCDAMHQRTFAHTLATALLAEPLLQQIDFEEFMPNDRRRIAQIRNQSIVTTPAPQPAPVRPATMAPAKITRTITDRRAPITELIRHLAQAVILIDAEGHLAGYSPAAASLLELGEAALGQSVLHGVAAAFAPVLTDALIGELSGPRMVILPNNEIVQVTISAVDHGTWALFITPTTIPNPVHPTVSAPPVPVVLPEIAAAAESQRAERFMASFANGMRAPLRALRDQIAQLPAAGELNDQQARLVGQLVKLNGEIMLLVNDLFVLGQMRMHVPESRVPLRIDLLIEAAVGTQYAEFGRRGQSVEMAISPDLPTVPGSEEGLWRALAAIIDNAIKYSPAGAAITIQAIPEQQFVRVTVSDSGPGLTSEELEQIFDPFYRAPSTESLNVPGRGLGLTIARAIVEQHGGLLTAESTMGAGTILTMLLPHQA